MYVCAGSFTGEVEAHGVLALKLTPIERNACDESWRPWINDGTISEKESVLTS